MPPTRTPADIRADLVMGLGNAKGEFVGIQLRDLRAVVDDSEMKSFLAMDELDHVLFGPCHDAKKLVPNRAGELKPRETVKNVLVQREPLLARLAADSWQPPPDVAGRVETYAKKCAAERRANQTTPAPARPEKPAAAQS